MAEWTSNYIGTWGFKLEVTTSVSGLKGTVNYKVTTCRMEGGSYNTRTNCWCKVYRDTNTLLNTYEKTTEATGLGVTIISGSYAIDLNNTTGKGSTTIRLEGNYGNKTHTVIGVSIANQTISISGGWSAVGNGTVTVKDNYNNTFTITATKGSNDATGNNVASGPSSLKYGYSTTTRNTAYTSGTAVALSIDGTTNNRTVYAEATTTGSKGGSTTATGQADIRQYIGPTPPGTPVISYSKSKLTNKEPWTFTWAPASATNTSSPVVGYRLRLYRNGNIINGIALKSGSKTELIKSGTEPLIDTNSTSCSITILDPTEFGFVPGDTVKLGIYSYTRFGQDNNDYTNAGVGILYNSDSSGTLEKRGTADAHVFSLDYPIQKAGLLKVNTPDGWKEGQAFIMTENGWKEASSIYVNTEKGWKEPK